MKKTLAIIFTALTLSACATHPSQIVARGVSYEQFTNQTCDQLILTFIDTRSRLDELTRSQEAILNKNSSVGLVSLFFLPAIFLAEGDNEHQVESIAVLKGELRAIETARAVNDCNRIVSLK